MSRRRTKSSTPSRIQGGLRSAHLFLTINQTLYAVHPLECEPSAARRAFRLNKADGTLYDVAQTQDGPYCDCPDFIFRRDGIDAAGCKHVQALVANGLIEGHSSRRGVLAVR